MTDQDNFDGTNESPDQQIDSTILRLVEQYASCDRRSEEINEERATIRENIGKLGFSSGAFQEGVRRLKKMSEWERNAHDAEVDRIVAIGTTKQAEFWPKQAEAQRKRAEERAAKESAKGPDADSNPRSDPNAGGAKPMTGDPDKPWPDDVATGTVQNPPGEAEAGDEALNAALPETKGKKRSQSAIAAEKAAAAGTDQPITVN